MSLRVLIDGQALPGAEAVAFWKRFSAWMDEHPGDLAGFAQGEGLASVHPEMLDGLPVLVASRSAPQGPYTTAPRRQSGSGGGKPGGSRGPQGGGEKRGAQGGGEKHGSQGGGEKRGQRGAGRQGGNGGSSGNGGNGGGKRGPGGRPGGN